MEKANKLLNLLMNDASSDGEILNARKALKKRLKTLNKDLNIGENNNYDFEEIKSIKERCGELILENIALKNKKAESEKLVRTLQYENNNIIYENKKLKDEIWELNSYKTLCIKKKGIIVGISIVISILFISTIWAFQKTISELEQEKYSISLKNNTLEKTLIEKEKKINRINNQRFKNSDFEKLTDKRKKLFYMIMAYKGVKNITDEDKTKFMNEFLGNKEGMEKPLKDVYNINIEDFERRYFTDESINEALRLYNVIAEDTFESIEGKWKQFFYMIMNYKNVENITCEDKIEFVEKFLNHQTGDTYKALKDVYGIDRNDFKSKYETYSARKKAFNRYN